MFTRLYAWMLRMAGHRRAVPALAAVSFAESSFFPLPPDIMLVPMVLARREHAWRVAAVCTIASVLGGLAGYAIGALLFETLGRWILDLYGATAYFDRVAAMYDEHGALAVVIGGLTPIPYKVVTIASGAFHYDILMFTLASAASRGLRFFAIAAVVWWFGPAVKTLLERYLVPVSWGFLVLLVGGFVALRWVF